MSLEDYNRKRNFDHTPEPKGEPRQKEKEKGSKAPLRFVVQLHDASRLHYDFRIEAGGVLKSWAVPKGPTQDPSAQHLAVQVEDHPLAYGGFEGIIPKGNYGAGTVMIWDEGTYIERNSEGREDSDRAVLKGIAERHVTLVLEGKKLHGEFALVGLKGEDGKSWLLIKKRDEYATRKAIPKASLSVKTGRTLDEIARQAEAKGEIWLPARTTSVHPTKKPLHPPPPPGVLPAKSSAHVHPDNEKFPHRNKPMLATPWPEPFEQKGWIFELERGGHRAIAEIEKGVVRLYSRQLLPFEKKYPKIIQALGEALSEAHSRAHSEAHSEASHSKRGTPVLAAALDTVRAAVLDGEVADEIYWVRDLLYLEGKSLRNLPLLERKQKLAALPLFNSRIRLVEHQTKCAPVFKKAEKEGYPAVLARDASSLYHEGTTKQWLRISAEGKEADRGPRLTHLDKVLWPQEKITKGDLIEYYRKIAPVLLPFLKDRPESMHRHPDGILNPGFFHKDLKEHHPRWVATERISSSSTGKSINYLLCQNEFTLLYMANLGCIELNPWLSRVGSLHHPDAIVIDLDPDDSNRFSEVVEVAREIHKILERVGVPHSCKTSGSTGSISIFRLKPDTNMNPGVTSQWRFVR